MTANNTTAEDREDEGFIAYHHERPECPYATGSREALDWYRGWQQGEALNNVFEVAAGKHG